MNEKDHIKETKKEIDYLLKEAVKECEDSMHGTYEATDCICQKLKKFSWIVQKTVSTQSGKRKVII
jgi:hypothetical protein